MLRFLLCRLLETTHIYSVVAEAFSSFPQLVVNASRSPKFSLHFPPVRVVFPHSFFPSGFFFNFFRIGISLAYFTLTDSLAPESQCLECTLASNLK